MEHFDGPQFLGLLVLILGSAKLLGGVATFLAPPLLRWLFPPHNFHEKREEPSGVQNLTTEP